MRKRFKFSLERILAIRRLEERMRRNLFLQAQTAFFAAEESKRNAERDLAGAQEVLAQVRRRSPLPVSECLQVDGVIEDVKKTILRRAKTVETRRNEMEKLRQEYLASSTRRKALEKLRATRLEKHRRELKAAENKMYDAIAVERNFAQKQKEQENA